MGNKLIFLLLHFMINTLAVPFHIEAYDGFAYTNGFAKIQTDHLLVEYQTKDSIIGVVKSGIKSVEIPYEEIVDINYKSNIFRTVILLSVSSFKATAELGNGSGDVKFYIKRKNRKMAENFVENLKIYVVEHQLKRLEEGENKGPELLDQ